MCRSQSGGQTTRQAGAAFVAILAMVTVLSSRAESGEIVGRVTRTDSGQGVPAIFVVAYSYPAGQYLAGATTAGDGTYVIPVVPPGQVALRTFDGPLAGLVDEFHADKACPGAGCSVAAATPVTIGAGTVTIDFALAVGGTIAGRLVDAGTNAPVSNVSVRARLTAASGPEAELIAYTDEAGQYSIRGVPTGSYSLRTVGAAPYIDQVYAPPNGIDCPGPGCTPGGGTPVQVVAGQPSTGRDFALRIGGSITGKVLASATGMPAGFVELRITRLIGGASFPVVGEFFSYHDGEYTVGGLPSGTYDVRTASHAFEGQAIFVDEVFDNVPCPGSSCAFDTGTLVVVTQGQQTAGIDFSLDYGGQFRGRVSDVSAPCEGACPGIADVAIEIYSSEGTPITQTISQLEGDYVTPGLPAGSYRAVARGTAAGFTSEIFREQPCTQASCNVLTGELIAVSLLGTTGGVDFTLVALPLAIEEVSPPFGPLAGGTQVVIRGVRFGSPATVTIGGQSATVVSVSSTQLVIVTPPGTSPGAKDVAVTVPAGTVTRPGGFTYAPPPPVQDVGGANAATRQPSLSGDGRYLAFVSAASNLVAGDTNGVDDVFVRDRATGTTVRISVDSDGDEANGPSQRPRISASGRYVAFLSTASNLVPGDTNGAADVFLHDRDVDGNGVFDEPGGRATLRVSVASSGAEANGPSGPPDISPEGLWVAFASAASNLVPGDTNGMADVFVHHWPSGQTSRVSVSSGGGQANGPSRAPALSRGAQRIVFASDASNLVAGDGNGRRDVFLHDRTDGSTVRVSTAAGTNGTGDANGDSDNPSIDDAGRTIAFETFATNIVSAASVPNTAQVVVLVLPVAGGLAGRVAAAVVDIGAAIRNLISGNAQGQPGTGNSTTPQVSGDGSAVGFDSAAGNLISGDTNGATDAFLARIRADGSPSAPERVSVDGDGNQASGTSGGVSVSGDGRTTSFESTAGLTPGTAGSTTTQVFVRGSRLLVTRIIPNFAEVGATSGVVFEGAGFNAGLEVRIGGVVVTSTRESDSRVVVAQVPPVTTPSLLDVSVTNPDGDRLTLPAAFTFVAPPASTADTDGDGLPDDWETRFGLDPLSAAGPDGANGDPDGDGVVNRDELAGGTHPRGTFVRFLAEGASSGFFSTRFALVNPSATQPVNALLRFQKADGTESSVWLTVPAERSRRVVANDAPGMASAEFATVVESDGLLVIDRQMTWDVVNRYGTHAEAALRGTSTIWYLAEGATHSGFELFYLLQNPSATAAEVTVRYLLPSGPPLEKSYTVGPRSRFNIWVDYEEFPAAGSGNFALANAEVSAVIRVTNGVPIIVERAMYLTRPGQLFAAGHASAGVTAPGLDWFLAEGATGDFFDLFVLLANPNAQDAIARITYLLDGGGTYTQTMVVPANSRQTIWVDYETPDGTTGFPLAKAELSTKVEVTNGVPIIVERAMWWPFDLPRWQEAHNSPGSTVTGTLWGIADGEVDGAPWYTSTYILVANPASQGATVDIQLLFEDQLPVGRTFAVPANSRLTIDVGYEFPESVGRRFGALVESRPFGSAPAAPIVVERANYNNALGLFWAAGSNQLATRLR